jgi:ABC-type nickel/cobalt efflux system permease component RcnA
MMDPGVLALMTAAALLAAAHALSPDHWFPFVAIGRADNWRSSRVLLLAFLAATGHIVTSIIVSLLTVFAEKGAPREVAEVLKEITPTLLIAFGVGYAFVSIWRLRKSRHGHAHGMSFLNRRLGVNPHDYEMHDHRVDESCSSDHHHEQKHCDCPTLPGDHMSTRAAWGLVVILGVTPCIALVPLTFAARGYGFYAVFSVIGVFAVSATASILIATWLALRGLRLIRLAFFDKYSSIAAGFVIALIGVAGHIFEHHH